jgi:hypothetical protein
MFQSRQDIHFLRQLLFLPLRHLQVMDLFPHQHLQSQPATTCEVDHVVAFADDFADQAKGAGANDSLDFVLFRGIRVHCVRRGTRWRHGTFALRAVVINCEEDRWCKQNRLTCYVISSSEQPHETEIVSDGDQIASHPPSKCLRSRNTI